MLLIYNDIAMYLRFVRSAWLLLRWCASASAFSPFASWCASAMLLGFCTALAAIFSAFCPLWVAYWSMICDVSIFAGCGLFFWVIWVWVYAPTPPQNREREIWAAFPKNFF